MARIECGPGGHVCGLFMEGHPLDGMTFGVVGIVTPLVDVWLDEGWLPDHKVVVADEVDLGEALLHGSAVSAQ